MYLNADRQLGDFVGELRQRDGVTFCKLADPACEGLGDPVEFALHGGREGSQPFVVHYERFDFLLCKRGVFGIELRVPLLLRDFEPVFGICLFVEQGGVVFQNLALKL
jgi:hypothetical protein